MLVCAFASSTIDFSLSPSTIFTGSRWSAMTAQLSNTLE